MLKIVLQGYIDIPATDLDPVLEELPNHIALTRQESGCLIFNVNQSAESRNRLFVYEEFTSQDAFDAHQKRVEESVWGRITRSAVRHYSITQVALDPPNHP